jgi:hypothetical protein
MAFTLALIGGIVGLFVTGAACLTAWLYRQHTRLPQEQAAGAVFLRWNVLDYAILLLCTLGALLLFTDLLAVMRDPASYPPHHFSYLLCGFVFTLLGMLFMAIRLAIALAVFKSSRVSPVNKHDQPGYADQAE